MATLFRNPEIDEYARLRAENEEEVARAERGEAMRRQRDQAITARQALETPSRHFERNFRALTDSRPGADKLRPNTGEGGRSRTADYYGFYYGQL